ncbi:MAG: VCBS repeat-containing protein, partial [Gammaproteobacteria bacterium]|nr:VCBS repeat-containing protein [Gammaproteobacteria bacterium]
MKKSATLKLAGVFSILAACGEGGGENPVAAPPLQSRSPLPSTPFVNVTTASNISFQTGHTRPALIVEQRAVTESTFGGAAAGDCDGDGDIDLFITYGNTGGPDGGGGPNRLYLNQLAEQGNGLLFEDTADAAGVANTRADGKGNDRHSGPTFADMDGDGDLDLFVGGLYSDPSHIYRNEGDCTFTDVTIDSPDIVNMRAQHTLSAGFGDYDLDGDLDMFLTHWGTEDQLYGVPRVDETDHLWRNDFVESGVLRFVNVSEASGLSSITWATRDYPDSTQIADHTFTATFARLDDDPWPDIAIAADFGTTQVALNNGDGTFRNLDEPALRNVQWGMGSALGDVDDDGDLDWFVTSIQGPGDMETTPIGNRFYRNIGGAALFADDTQAVGVSDGDWGWAACFLDIDNDGDLDIYHTNGWPAAFLGAAEGHYANDRSRAFVQRADGTFGNGAAALGIGDDRSSRGVVCADFDNDGDTDLLTLTNAAPNSALLWENRSAAAGNNYLRVELTGTAPNPQAAGARIF